jgi:hypothetical protein
VNVSATAAVGGGAGFLATALTNDLTGETMTGHVIGATVGEGANASISFSDATGFATKEALDFEDFQNAAVEYSSFGISFFFGYSFSSITFLSKGTGTIDVSGATAGTPGTAVTTIFGVFRFDSNSFSPTMVPIEGSEEATEPYVRTEKGEDAWTVLLDTESDTMDEVEQALLDSFLTSVVAMRR